MFAVELEDELTLLDYQRALPEAVLRVECERENLSLDTMRPFTAEHLISLFIGGHASTFTVINVLFAWVYVSCISQEATHLPCALADPIPKLTEGENQTAIPMEMHFVLALEILHKYLPAEKSPDEMAAIQRRILSAAIEQDGKRWKNMTGLEPTDEIQQTIFFLALTEVLVRGNSAYAIILYCLF